MHNQITQPNPRTMSLSTAIYTIYLQDPSPCPPRLRVLYLYFKRVKMSLFHESFLFLNIKCHAWSSSLYSLGVGRFTPKLQKDTTKWRLRPSLSLVKLSFCYIIKLSSGGGSIFLILLHGKFNGNVDFLNKIKQWLEIWAKEPSPNYRLWFGI